MTETATNTIESYKLTEGQEAQRQAAETWISDAVKLYDDEVAEHSASYSQTSTRSVGHAAVAPNIQSAPEHIKHGTQIDQEIWQAENADEDDYQTRLDEDNRPPTADEIAHMHEQDVSEEHEGKLLDVLHGNSQYDDGLKGDLSYVTTGQDPVEGSVTTLEDFMHFVEPYASLQEIRTAALEREQSDPLRDQMKERFEV